MTELLAPAGNMEALKAAISNGANAVYLGMNKFGARAYANNFDFEDLKLAIEYAHLRNVKIYVTMNTIVFTDELKDAYEQIDKLYLIGVDGIIVQDLALLSYIVDNYPLLEAHISTQMGVDDLEGTLLFKELGAKRVVLSREVPIDKIKEIKEKAKIPLEIFVHGALCVSYSGNCLMSGLIGYRSGNRGRCVGSCRKKYELIDETGKVISNTYILSMKDLNTIENIEKLKVADSLKIEGRMKEPVYVANVIKQYRDALDNGYTPSLQYNLKKTFNRTYTKGYIFGEDKKNITNVSRPNNFGYKIGVITAKNKLGYEITLNDSLNQNDLIRIDNDGFDINLSVSKLYDKKDNLISSSKGVCYIKIKESVKIGSIVYKTKDINYTDELLKSYPKEFERIPIRLSLYGDPGYPVSITIDCDGNEYYIESDFTLDKAINSPTTEEGFFKQFNRLNDTPYMLEEVEYYLNDVFIPAGKINDLRRKIINYINENRLLPREEIVLNPEEFKAIPYELSDPDISVYCNTEEQYLAAKELGITTIYYKDNVVRRNENNYSKKTGPLLVGGYGGLYKYRKTNELSTDFSFNVVNYKSVYLLHKQGVKKVCLSYEMNSNQINDLVNEYKAKVGYYPNLEMIVYGRADLMFTKYCPLKANNLCGECKKHQYTIKEEYGEFPIISHPDCTTTIINGKILNLIDDLETIEGISTFRLQFTIESKDEVIRVINMFKDKLKNKNKTSLFNKDTDTRAHFNKEIL